MRQPELTIPTVTPDSEAVPTKLEPARSPRRGGRGCPECGSHTTRMLGKTEQLCRDCGRVWSPCAPFCRGYRVDVRDDAGPTVVGCPDCGVPTRIARHWPEAWRALARELDDLKLAPIPDR